MTSSAKHEIAPEVGGAYLVNGVEMVVKAVTNSPTYHAHVHSTPFGSYGFCSRRYGSGRVAKAVVAFRNCANDPSWFNQDVRQL